MKTSKRCLSFEALYVGAENTFFAWCRGRRWTNPKEWVNDRRYGWWKGDKSSRESKKMVSPRAVALKAAGVGSGWGCRRRRGHRMSYLVCGYIIISTAASTATESFPAANNDEDRSGKDIAIRLFDCP